MTNHEFDKQMNATHENSGFRGHDNTVKGRNVTREYELYNVAKEWRKQRHLKRLNLHTQAVETNEDLELERELAIRTLQSQNNEISNSCQRGLLASKEQLDTIKRIVIENNYEHMTIPQIQAYLDDLNYFEEGHALTAEYFRYIAKRRFNQKHRQHTPLTGEKLYEIGRLANERYAKTKTSRPDLVPLTPAPVPLSVIPTTQTLAYSLLTSNHLELKTSKPLSKGEQVIFPLSNTPVSRTTASVSPTILGQYSLLNKRPAVKPATSSSSSSNKKRRVGWTNAEDELLRKSVTENNAKNWGRIAQALPGRTSQLCRTRWCNHLDPNINKSNWTEEEDKIIIRVHGEKGNKWAEIAKCLNGRTDLSIKNRYNTTLKRLIGNPVDVKSIRNNYY